MAIWTSIVNNKILLAYSTVFNMNKQKSKLNKFVYKRGFKSKQFNVLFIYILLYNYMTLKVLLTNDIIYRFKNKKTINMLHVIYFECTLSVSVLTYHSYYSTNSFLHYIQKLYICHIYVLFKWNVFLNTRGPFHKSILWLRSILRQKIVIRSYHSYVTNRHNLWLS